GWHATGAHDQLFRQLNRNNVASLHVQNVPQFQLAASQGRTERHADIEDVFAQGLDPTLVLIVHIRLETGIEHLADRLDHRIGHGDMQVTAAAIELDMEGRNHHHLAGADDIGQGRIHLRVDVLEVDIQHRMPGFLEIGESLVDDHAYH